MKHKLNTSQSLEYLEKMLVIRQFEEACAALYMKRKIGGFLHLYIGQEAVAVGAESVLGENDYVVSHYRDHGHAIARGMDPKTVMAELLGKSDGSSRGKGGSMHLFDASKNFMGGYAIVGGQLPIAVGLGLACKMKNNGNVVLCFLGDGAVNQGTFHESLNLASLWDLPIIFFLENNLYGMGTHVEFTHAIGKDLYTMADSYKMAAAQIDGMDLVTVRDTTLDALQQIHDYSKPMFIEAMTYRFRGHSMADPGKYREKSELQDWQTNDPIEKFKTLCIKRNLLTQDQIDQITKNVSQTIDMSVEFAEKSPKPSLESMLENVYGETQK